MSHEPVPPLRCESRRPKPPDAGWLKWALALVVISASTLDALWLIPAQRDAERARRAHLRDLRGYQCPGRATPDEPPRARASRVNDILLLAPPTDAELHARHRHHQPR